VPVDPIKPMFKGTGAERLKPEYAGPLPQFAFNFNLRRYNEVSSSSSSSSSSDDSSTSEDEADKAAVGGVAGGAAGGAAGNGTAVADDATLEAGPGKECLLLLPMHHDPSFIELKDIL
jgi:hypothetical protein